MKISSTIPSIGNASDAGRSRPVNGTAQRPAASGDTQVELSPLSARLQELQAGISTSPVVDARRIAEIKQAITEGRFKIDPERITDGLLNSVRQMLAKDH